MAVFHIKSIGKTPNTTNFASPYKSELRKLSLWTLGTDEAINMPGKPSGLSKLHLVILRNCNNAPNFKEDF